MSKSKYNKDIVDRILKSIRIGLDIQDACLVHGINRETMRIWTKKYPEFREKCDEARAINLQEHIGTIKKASEKKWQAAAWYAERTRPDQYALKGRVELTGANGKPFEIKISGLKNKPQKKAKASPK